MSRRLRWARRSRMVLRLLLAASVRRLVAAASVRRRVVRVVSVLPLAVHKLVVRNLAASVRRPLLPRRRPLPILTARLPARRSHRLRASSISRSIRSAAPWWLTRAPSIRTPNRNKAASVARRQAALRRLLLAVTVVPRKVVTALRIRVPVVLPLAVHKAAATVVLRKVATVVLPLAVHKAAATAVLPKVVLRKVATVALRKAATAVLRKAAATVVHPRVAAMAHRLKRPVVTAHPWACPAVGHPWCTPVGAAQSAPSAIPSW